MADSLMSYAIVVGIFVFLTGILFGSRARRYRRGYSAMSSESNRSEAA